MCKPGTLSLQKEKELGTTLYEILPVEIANTFSPKSPSNFELVQISNSLEEIDKEVEHLVQGRQKIIYTCVFKEGQD